MIVNCFVCSEQKEIPRAWYRKSPTKRFYCSKEHWTIGFKKVMIGRSAPWSTNRLMGMSGEKNQNWKGNKVGYAGLHAWVKKHLGKPQKCSCCGTTEGKMDWANISQQYKRDLTDWERLCRYCHVIKEKRWKNLEKWMMERVNKNFSKIKPYIKIHENGKMTYKEIADRVGLHYNTIYRYFNKKGKRNQSVRI